MSNYQLGGVISQEGCPIAFFSRKINTSQKKYTTTEKELLGMTETIKQIKIILYRQKVVVLTDQFNLTYDTTDHASNRVLWQRLLLEEYRVECCIKGEKNVVTDALSCLPKQTATLKNAANIDSFLDQAESFLNQ